MPRGDSRSGKQRKSLDGKLSECRSRLQSAAVQTRELAHRSVLLKDRSVLLKEQSHEQGVAFLVTELGASLTFANIALEATPNSAKRHANQVKARKAYDTALDWNKRLRLTDAETKGATRKLSEVESALERLGEEL